MNRTVVRTRTANRRVNSLSRSFNDLSCGQELYSLKSSLASPTGNEQEKCASFPSITLPKISSGHGKDDLQCQLSAAFSQVETVAYTETSIKEPRLNSSQKRPKSCTARVQSPTSISSPRRTPELLRRNRRPRPSLPLGVAVIEHFHNVPSSPTLRTKSPNVSSYSKQLNLSKSAAVEETELVDVRRRSQDVTNGGSCSTPPMSPALLRKFENSDKTVRKAKNLIDDYKRSNQQHHRQQEERKSLAEAMEEVKNCRYLRVVKRKDTCSTHKEKAGD